MPVFVTFYFTWQFKKYCKFQKIGFEFFLRPLWYAPFFFFFERHTINILCGRAWLILHSGGYMSKPHLDSWVKYTGQRNLWDPEKLTCRMKRSHLRLFPHPASLSHSSLAQDFSPSSRWGAHCVSWCCWAWHLPAEKIECHLIMQPSCGKHGVCNQIDRRSAQNLLCEVEMVRRAWRTVALGTTPYPKKISVARSGFSKCFRLLYWPLTG